MRLRRGVLGITTFLSGTVRLAGEREALRLSPWPLGDDAEGPGLWLVEAEDEGWRLSSARGRRGAGGELLIALDGARYEPVVRGAAVDTSSLMLVCPTGVDELQVLPLVELDAKGCTVESPIALLPGRAFPNVELHGDAGVLRRASAVVTESAPWLDHFGRTFFRHRLRFDLPTPQDPGPEYDVLTEAEGVDRVLSLAALLHVEIATDAAEPGCRFEVADVDQLVISGGSWSSVGPIHIAFDLFALRYEATVRALGRNRTTRPLVLRRLRRRAESRISASGLPLELRFRHPLRSEPSRAPLLDLSMRGLCFDARVEPLLWPGLMLHDARLHTPSCQIPLGTMEVRDVTARKAHVLLTRADLASDPSYGELLATLRHPDLTVHRGETIDAQWLLYEQCGLVMPYMRELLDADPTRVREAWRRGHELAPNLCRTFARYEEDLAVASVSALQAWDRTWLGQHLAARPDRTGCTPGELLTTFLDHVLLRSDCRQMIFFAAATNKKMNTIHGRFQDLTGTPEAVARIALSAWTFREPPRAESPVPRRATRSDRRVLARSVRRDWGPLAARAFSFDESTLALSRLRSAYRRAGLRRERTTLVSADGTLARWAAVTERGEPGLCIPGFLQATWLLPLHSGDDDALHVRSLVSELRLEANEPHRLVVTSANLPREPFERAGLTHAFDANAYIINRAGLRRYASFLLESYGTVGTRERKVTP